MSKYKFTLLICIISLLFPKLLSAQSVKTNVKEKNNAKVFQLSNDKVVQRVFIKNKVLVRDALSGEAQWLKEHQNSNPYSVSTDGDFALKMMWTDWSAPGRVVNADNQITFDKKDYRYQSYDFKDLENGGKILELFFKPVLTANTIQLRITYQLLPGKFYARRKIAVRDEVKESNWLELFLSRKGEIHSRKTAHYSIIKKGSFGQPAAVNFSNGGVFFGIEYPAATTTIHREKKTTLDLKCKEIIGTVVKKQWVNSKWVVEGLAPDHYVKNWFFKYLPDIRYAKNEPYALYNSWYDLRSPAFKKVAKEHIMNEKNIMTIIKEFKKNMIEPYGIHLDAFVLDDGWDIHKSAWKLDPKTFPHGLKPISNALDKLGTTLGIWYGPTGGYSFRKDRIDWMRDHGYETVIGRNNRPMLCIGSKKYGALFQKRTTDMVKNGGVGYFKWDGLQFSCSNPTHGHPIGVYSRRAILDSLIAKCKAVRETNPDVYLNITSGTWLSPWWMMFANQIWMQGRDYGFADVPSFSQRDASMTYKDMVLYNDFHNEDQWFPLSNLMTHGIIKGRLNEIGGADDPLSKFTDDAMFYFGRGVTMYELYISPDLLDAGEWSALSKSLKWAEDRFPILDKNAFMIGGNPTKGAAYGYTHFKKNKGIIALRNPGMEAQNVNVKLDPAHGIAPEAHSLVLERVYPDHWIAPDLYAAGATIKVPLNGYQSAIYEVYPLDSANRPLLAGVTFREKGIKGNNYKLNILKTGEKVKFLNPEKVASVEVNGTKSNPLTMDLPQVKKTGFKSPDVNFSGNTLTVKTHFDSKVEMPRLVVSLHPDSALQGKAFPKGKLQIDGKTVKATWQHQKGIWDVYSYMLRDRVAGSHTFKFELEEQGNTHWKGHADVLLFDQHKVQPVLVSITSKKNIDNTPMPPSPFEEASVGEQQKLGEGVLQF